MSDEMCECNLCGDRLDVTELLDHLRVMHPADYGDGPECWPDGSLVIVDETDYTADEIGEVS